MAECRTCRKGLLIVLRNLRRTHNPRPSAWLPACLLLCAVCAVSFVFVSVFAFALPARAEETAETPAALLDRAEAETDDVRALSLLMQAVTHPDATAEEVRHADSLAYDRFGGDSGELVGLLETIVALGRPDLSDFSFFLAERYFQMERPDDALAVLEAVCAAAPDDEDTWLNRVFMAYYYLDAEPFLGIAEASLARFPDNAHLQIYAAYAYDELYEYDQAIALAKVAAKALLKQEESIEGYYDLYDIQRHAGEFEDALKSLERVIGWADEDVSLYVERAEVKLWQLNDPERALADLAPLALANPDDVNVRYDLFICHTWLEEDDAAKADIEAMRALDADLARLMEGTLALERENLEDALVALGGQANGAYPGEALRLRALLALWLEGDADSAADYIDQAFDVYGTRDGEETGVSWTKEAFEDWMARAEAAETDEEYNALMDELNTAMMASYEAEVPEALYRNAGTVAFHQGNWLQAQAQYSAARAATWDNPYPSELLALLYRYANDLDSAEAVVREMEAEYPGWYETLWARMALLADRGDFPGALAVFEQIKAKFPFAANEAELTGAVLRALAAGDGETLRAADLVARGPDSLDDPRDLANHAYLCIVTGETGLAAQYLEEADALLERGGYAPGVASQARQSVAENRAELAFALGDIDGVETYLRAACEAGDQPRVFIASWSLRPWLEGEGSAFFQALCDEYPLAAGLE